MSLSKLKIYATVNKIENLLESFGKSQDSGQVSQTLPPVRGCVRLLRRGRQAGTLERLRAVCGLCARLESRDSPCPAGPLEAEVSRF